MINKHTVPSLLACCLTLSAAVPVLAYEEGDFVVRAGLTHVAPKSNGSSHIIIGDPTDLSVSVDSDTQLGLNLVYFLSPQIGVELLAATPFTHDIDLQGAGDGDGPLGETTHLPPTLSAVYYFTNPQSTFQPYVGLGINYTVFFDEDFTSERKTAGFSDLSLDSSWGIAAQLGADIQLDDKWHINASVRYLDIGTTASFNVGDAAGSVDVDIDPWVYTLAAGYAF